LGKKFEFMDDSRERVRSWMAFRIIRKGRTQKCVTDQDWREKWTGDWQSSSLANIINLTLMEERLQEGRIVHGRIRFSSTHNEGQN
jgi:hypothetical protein